MPVYEEILNITSSDGVDIVVVNPNKDDPSVIPAGLSSDIMRKSMETKNLLPLLGDLYVGTGTVDNVSNTVVTGCLHASRIANTVLCADGTSNVIGYHILTPEYFYSGDDSMVFDIVASGVATDEINRYDSDTPVPTADYALYASSDTSKGSIEYRLRKYGY